MTNTVNFDYNNKAFTDNTVAVMKDLLASKESGSSMDDAYKAVCKYAALTREQFDSLYQQAEAKLESWENEGLLSGRNCELSEEALDMVVGGGIGSFFSAIGDALSSAAKATGDFIAKNAAVISLVAGIAMTAIGATMLITGIGSAAGAGLVTMGVCTAIVGGCSL